ncbi:MAG: DUF4416 family protein [Planctomycetes bacterium]|nr:DUF4416 family protein [Planctomycetota bacterium]
MPMGTVRAPRRAKLFCGLLSGDADLLAEARRRLGKQLGLIDSVSDVWPFEATDYYRDELGEGVLRQFVSFADLISIERFADIKRLTNALELRLGQDLALPEGQRPINLDPGYLDLSKLVLATTKDQAHRLYIGGGMYAEVTLRFEQGAWRAWPWTYPDFAAPTYRAFFAEVRQTYQRQQSPGQQD